MLCNIRKKKVAVLLMGPNEWLLYWFLFEGLILNDFLISPGLPPLPWFGVRSPCSYSKVFAYAALPPPLVKAGGITDDWKVNGRMKWGGWGVCLTGNWSIGRKWKAFTKTTERMKKRKVLFEADLTEGRGGEGTTEQWLWAVRGLCWMTREISINYGKWRGALNDGLDFMMA